MEKFKKPENFIDILNLQKHLDKNLNNIRPRYLRDIKLSLIAECIEFNEETLESHKTWKTKSYDEAKELEELTDIWFFTAQIVNHCEATDQITIMEKESLDRFFKNRNSIYMEKCDVLTIIFDLKASNMDYNWLKFLVIDLMELTNKYGYKTVDILECYWNKWQKNMKRIGKEWN